MSHLYEALAGLRTRQLLDEAVEQRTRRSLVRAARAAGGVNVSTQGGRATRTRALSALAAVGHRLLVPVGTPPRR